MFFDGEVESFLSWKMKCRGAFFSFSCAIHLNCPRKMTGSEKIQRKQKILSLPLPPDFFYDFLLFRKLADKLRKIKILFDEIS